MKHLFLSHMKPLSVYCLLLFFLLQSCGNVSRSDCNGKEISIYEFDKKLNLNEFANDVTKLELETDSFMIGELKDLCFIDSILYALDGITHKLFAYDMVRKSVVKSIDRVGNGPMEYVRPMALDSDEENIYVLDFPTRKVLTFSRDLTPVREFRLPFAAWDFVKTDNGFLFCNMTINEDLKKIVETDDEGLVVNNYLSENPIGATGGQCFIKTSAKDIYVLPPYSNYSYEWTENGLKDFYSTDFGSKNMPRGNNQEMGKYEEEYAYNTDIFVVSKYVLFSFLYKGKRIYSFIDREKGVQKSGIAYDKTRNFPFYPRWQYKNSLIGAFREDTGGEDLKLSLLFFKF